MRNSSVPPIKDGNAPFTPVPLKALLIKYEFDINIKYGNW